MINDSVQNQLLQLVARNTAQQPTREAQQPSVAFLQLNPGQQVKAEILSTLSNHLYLARVAGELFKLEIPLIVQPGQSVPLTLVAVKPRVVFEVHREQEGKETVSLSFLGKSLSGADGVEPLGQEETVPQEPFPEEMPLPSWPLPEGLEEGVVLPAPEDERRSLEKLRLTPGQLVKGEVSEALGKNRYLVTVGGETFRLELPQELQKGESVSLTFVASAPRVLFDLQAGEGPTEPVRLSSLGKWLASAPQEASSPSPLQGSLLEHPAQSSSLLAARLKDALTLGGLFYESHLARWAAGSLPLQELLKEPQGKLSRLRRGASAGKGEALEHGNGIADDRTLPLVREQLLLLNSGVLTFKGEPWPGQVMELSLQEGEDEPGVEATLALELPRLGAVRARLKLGREGVALELVAQEKESCRILKEGEGELQAASSASGVRLHRVSVRHEEEGE